MNSYALPGALVVGGLLLWLGTVAVAGPWWAALLGGLALGVGGSMSVSRWRWTRAERERRNR